MHAAYAIVCVTPVLITLLSVIGFVCYAIGNARAEYRWNCVDEQCDDTDTAKYYVAMLPSLEETRRPSPEELADMDRDLAETADEEFNAWVDAIEADKEYQEREERRLRIRLGWDAPRSELHTAILAAI